MVAFICSRLPKFAAEERKVQPEDEVSPGAGARMQQDRRKSRHARRDHQLRSGSPTAN